MPGNLSLAGSRRSFRTFVVDKINKADRQQLLTAQGRHQSSRSGFELKLRQIGIKREVETSACLADNMQCLEEARGGGQARQSSEPDSGGTLEHYQPQAPQPQVISCAELSNGNRQDESSYTNNQSLFGHPYGSCLSDRTNARIQAGTPTATAAAMLYAQSSPQLQTTAPTATATTSTPVGHQYGRHQPAYMVAYHQHQLATGQAQHSPLHQAHNQTFQLTHRTDHSDHSDGNHLDSSSSQVDVSNGEQQQQQSQHAVTNPTDGHQIQGNFQISTQNATNCATTSPAVMAAWYNTSKAANLLYPNSFRGHQNQHNAYQQAGVTSENVAEMSLHQQNEVANSQHHFNQNTYHGPAEHQHNQHPVNSHHHHHHHHHQQQQQLQSQHHHHHQQQLHHQNHHHQPFGPWMAYSYQTHSSYHSPSQQTASAEPVPIDPGELQAHEVESYQQRMRESSELKLEVDNYNDHQAQVQLISGSLAPQSSSLSSGSSISSPTASSLLLAPTSSAGVGRAEPKETNASRPSRVRATEAEAPDGRAGRAGRVSRRPTKASQRSGRRPSCATSEDVAPIRAGGCSADAGGDANNPELSTCNEDTDFEDTSSFIVVTDPKSGRTIQLSNEQLIGYTARQLNKTVAGFPSSTIKELKQRRRRLKNRGYAQNCRHKRLDHKVKLELQNDALRAKNLEQSRLINELREEIQELRCRLCN